MVTATNQNANQDEPDLWMPDSKSFSVGGKMRQTTARRVRCPNKSASGNHLSQNDPLPPAVDDEVVEQPGSTRLEGADNVVPSSTFLVRGRSGFEHLHKFQK